VSCNCEWQIDATAKCLQRSRYALLKVWFNTYGCNDCLSVIVVEYFLQSDRYVKGVAILSGVFVLQECEVNLKGVATGRSFLLKLTTHGVSGLAPQAACSTCMELAHSHRNCMGGLIHTDAHSFICSWTWCLHEWRALDVQGWFFKQISFKV
jgi:hypothetical protein